MTGTDPERRPRPLPLGFFGMLALILVIERVEMHNNPSFQSFHSATWRYASNHVESKSRGRDVLCFGDSMVKFGVLPPVVRERTGQSVYNLAVTVGPAPASYFLFRRALEAGARPSTVVVDFLGGLQKEGPSSKIIIFPWSDMLRLTEAVDLAWTARDPALFARAMLGELLHSYKDRYEIRAHVRSSLGGERNHQPMVLAISHRNWKRNDGGHAQIKARFEEVPPPPPGPRRQGTWRCDPVNEVYLRRFLALAAEHRITVCWLLPPFSPATQSHAEQCGDDDRYVEFVRKQQADFPNVVVLDGRRPGLSKSYFFDDRHLDRDGAVALSAELGDALRRRMSGKLQGNDWIALSHAGERRIAVIVEDVEQSRSVLRTQMVRRRR